MKKTIANSISEKIKKGDVTMRSQLSVMTEKFGLSGSIIILFILLCTIAGFVFYWINSNNDLLFGVYGQYGLSSFIQSFPYIFIIGFIALFIFLIVMFRKFDFSYKKPFYLILLIVAIGILAIGWFSIKQPISQKIYQNEGRFFRMGMMNNKNAVSGVVKEISASTIIIQDDKGISTIVNLTNDVHFPFGKPKIGDSVRVVGIWNESAFNAFGIRVFDENNPSILGPGMMRGRGQGRGQGQGRGMMWNR